MNDDALAAVIAAAQRLIARHAAGPAPPPGARWPLAVRMRATDVAMARRAAGARSRWSLNGRLS